jgi:uncharacterized repeat protein (TIGR01451 family)
VAFVSINDTLTAYAGHDAGAGCPGVNPLTMPTYGTGQEVTLCFVLHNVGDEDVASFEFAMGAYTLADLVPIDATLPMPPGEDRSWYLELTVDETIELETTFTVRPPQFVPSALAFNGITITVPNPLITVEKTVYGGSDGGAGCPGGTSETVAVGDAVTYCFAISDAGDTPLSDVQLVDAALGIDENDLTVLSGDLSYLGVNGTIDAYYQTTATADLENTATVSAQPLAGNTPIGERVEATDSAELFVLETGIDVQKTVYAGHDAGAGCTQGAGSELVVGQVGDPVTYCFTVTDPATADTLLEGIELSDGDLGITDTNMAVQSGTDALTPGGAHVLSYETTIGGDLVNTVTACGAPTIPEVFLGADECDSDTAEVRVPGPDLALQKTAEVDGPTTPGSVVTWTIVVSNLGGTDVDGSVQVTDLLPDGLELLSASGLGWTCVLEQPVVCERADGAAAGAELPPITVTTEVLDGTGGSQLVNEASVSADAQEGSTENNDDDAFVEVLAGDEPGPGEPDEAADPTSGGPGGSSSGGTLPRTGGELLALLLLGAALTAVGAGLQIRRLRP